MKRIATLSLLLISLVGFSQQKEVNYPQDENKKNELKISTTSLIIFGAVDVSYERLVNQNTSYGASVFINADSDGDLDFDRNYTVNPFLRWFFSEKKFARGFFIEGFGSLNSSNDYKESKTYDEDVFFYSQTEEKETNVRFALGISTGGKFVLKTGFIAEVFLGIGRNIIGDTDSSYDSREFIPRGGISLGYRF